MALTLEQHFCTVEVYTLDDTLLHTHSDFPIVKIAELLSNWSFLDKVKYKVTTPDGDVQEIIV